jgi:molybdopterin-binding protein
MLELMSADKLLPLRSADELKLEKGKTAYAVIKATSVMVGVD